MATKKPAPRKTAKKAGSPTFAIPKKPTNRKGTK